MRKLESTVGVTPSPPSQQVSQLKTTCVDVDDNSNTSSSASSTGSSGYASDINIVLLSTADRPSSTNDAAIIALNSGTGFENVKKGNHHRRRIAGQVVNDSNLIQELCKAAIDHLTCPY